MQSMSQWSEILPQYRVELWIHRYLSSSAESECVVPMVAQVLNSDASRSPCCHLQGVSMPSLELAEGFAPFTVKGCKSSVCRYVSMNRMLREAARTRSAHIAALERLKQSLKQCGFHPYRLFPSAPDLAGAQSILMASR